MKILFMQPALGYKEGPYNFTIELEKEEKELKMNDIILHNNKKYQILNIIPFEPQSLNCYTGTANPIDEEKS